MSDCINKKKPFEFLSFLVFLQGVASDLSSGHQNICQLGSAAAAAAAMEENKPTLPLDNGSDGDTETMMMMMTRGMTTENFDPVRYSGRWFEVASLKRGFAGQGQEDCHCTQVYIILSLTPM